MAHDADSRHSPPACDSHFQCLTRSRCLVPFSQLDGPLLLNLQIVDGSNNTDYVEDRLEMANECVTAMRRGEICLTLGSSADDVETADMHRAIGAEMRQKVSCLLLLDFESASAIVLVRPLPGYCRHRRRARVSFRVQNDQNDER